jgi:hypothetical protein
MPDFRTYVICDSSFFAILACYSLIRLISSAVHSHHCYRCRAILRSAAFIFAFTLSISFLVANLNPSAPGQGFFQFAVTFSAAWTWIAFLFAIRQWDALCHAVPFRPCPFDVFTVVMILVVGTAAVGELCTYFIRTHASPYVFFFQHNFTVFVQMGFLLGYGSFRVRIVLVALGTSPFVVFALRSVAVLTVAVMSVVLFEFGAFVASFCVNLDVKMWYNLFTVLCSRIPMFFSVLCALLFQDLMDATVERVAWEEKDVAKMGP